MDKKILKMLVFQSYTQGELDEEKVSTYTQKLNRRQLKEYINALKQEEKKRVVEVFLTQQPNLAEKQYIKKTFPKKKIMYYEDPSLLAGIKIKNNDDLYEFNLRDGLESFITKIAEDL